MRSTRNQSFCWQEKKINRLIQDRFEKSERVKMLLLYATLTWLDSDFNSKDIKYYTQTISAYSGLGKEFIPKGLKLLEALHVLRIIQEKEAGKFKGKKLIYTPEKVKEIPRKSKNRKTVHIKTSIGKSNTSEDSSLIEDSSIKEDSKKDANAFSLSSEEKKNNDKDIYVLVEMLISLYHEKIRPAVVTKTGKQCIIDRLERFTLDELKEAINRFSSNPWRMKKNAMNGIEWFFKNDVQIQRWIWLEKEEPRRVYKI